VHFERESKHFQGACEIYWIYLTDNQSDIKKAGQIVGYPAVGYLEKDTPTLNKQSKDGV
jgi:hypothetical protein